MVITCTANQFYSDIGLKINTGVFIIEVKAVSLPLVPGNLSIMHLVKCLFPLNTETKETNSA